jgi:predicted RNase H-like nuclease (RuvC/YqgF family)
MSSLKEKAKTLNELLWENRLEWDKWLRMGVTEQKQIELAPKYQEKWVRFEDAEQALLDRLIPLEQQIDTLQRENQTLCDIIKTEEKEREELKQKLQQLLDKFPKSEFATMGNLKQISTTFKGEEVQNWKKKFEELLKEADIEEE